MHQLPYVGITPILAIHIKNMFPIRERFTRGNVHSLDKINWLAFPVKVLFGERMVADGILTLEKIAEYVGLSLDEVKKLKAGQNA